MRCVESGEAAIGRRDFHLIKLGQNHSGALNNFRKDFIRILYLHMNRDETIALVFDATTVVHQ